ncbi:phosphoglycerate mutase [Agaricicola taiwanensis]|uniref:Phosphoglycerate mutase n=1 Tax=Agaricicola taiwanensis TaxID=591372 RepID=A0A8J2YGK5_9RHOB|nr:histidine phosphatase family protein [Agaricicola taiwanensis]GGE35789.1 phosphoglycerate mutase [Agaricicola taiwanensis]
MRLCVVRHGETDWNAEGRLQGQQDIPLNGRGRAQAEGVGHILRQDGSWADADFISSPLLRTRHTMELMREAMGLPASGYRVEPRLAELTFGDWEGLTWPEVRARDEKGATAREFDKWGFVPPNGESYAMLQERLEPWLGTIRDSTVIVSHGGVARVLLAVLGRVEVTLAPLLDIQQGRALVFDDDTYHWL